jgi:DNA adenine methylase
MKKLKTPITYYGGKQNLISVILPLIIPHNLYCEPFFGGGAIFFAKEKSQVEVINDINLFAVNFYEECQLNFEALQRLVQATPHSRNSHRQAWVIYNNPDMFSKLRRAWAFWVLTTLGFSGMISNSFGYGVKQNKSELRTNNKRQSFLPELKQRLDIVQIERTDAMRVIKSRDREDTFFYLDPPYPNADQAHYSGYTMANFIELLELLKTIKGKFLLSSYPYAELEKYSRENGWTQFKIEQRLTVSAKAGTGRKKIETLTANYDINALLPAKYKTAA